MDTLIRQLTHGTKSLDDFERIFLGKGGNTGPEVLPYDFGELVDNLNQVVAYEWSAFLKQRVSRVQLHADLDGIERGGYRLIYAEQPSQAERTFSNPAHALYAGEDFWYSLGLRINERGALIDVRWNSPGDQAKLVPQQKVLTVNGAAYTADGLRAAVAKAKTDPAPIHLTVQQEGETVSADIDYHAGERYPILVRVPEAENYLDRITVPRVHTQSGS